MPLALTAAIVHLGLMDGSAGIAVSKNEFITVSDEVNWIQRFSTESAGTGEMALDLNKEANWFHARPREEDPKLFIEADIEGAARVGDVIFWIGSHGFHKDEARDHRVFFATEFDKKGVATPHGHVYRGLLEDLLAEESLKQYPLEAAATIKPKEPGGLNIESLCTAADGKTLLIGFRNPILKDGRALVVELLNPQELVEGTGKAKFGKVLTPDLHGLGLRDMVWWREKYLIIAGHYKSHLGKTDGLPDPAVPASRLYRWSGESNDNPELLNVDLNDYNPEALIVIPDDRLLILSDDGGNQKGLPQEKTHFRSVWLEGQE